MKNRWPGKSVEAPRPGRTEIVLAMHVQNKVSGKPLEEVKEESFPVDNRRISSAISV
jgi:hypothetical protein